MYCIETPMPICTIYVTIQMRMHMTDILIYIYTESWRNPSMLCIYVTTYNGIVLVMEQTECYGGVCFKLLCTTMKMRL